ncbi:MAG: divalent metal cation transporter [Acidobacteria bacterium]|jgi:Mn2+/Fe2+ NRAMP family transporter|nr:MAG: divalent metal cation transporter [Acidobacteriota bacterium]GIU81426.1 MAG: Mn transporter [Pyrinomonadaceae bacterium]
MAKTEQIKQRLKAKLTLKTSRFSRSIFASRNRLFIYLSLIGPGIISASSGNEASGIATYSVVGAEYGYSLLWAFIPMTIFFIFAQEMCVRMGVVTGQGLADLIREHFGVRWTAVVMLALLIANTGIIIAEFVGIAQASEIFGIPRYFSIPLSAISIWWLVVKGTSTRVERVFLMMSLVFLAYIISAFLAGPDWGRVGREFITPSFKLETGYLFTVTALIGTTITPFMQVFVQSSVVEKGLQKEDLPVARADAIVGVLSANTIAAFIVICTAATLHVNGIRVETASDAARALSPVMGEYAEYLFAVGLFGASMLAMGVLPLATAYSLSEALGFEKGISYSFREAPIFLGIFTSLIVIGALVALIPNIPQIPLLLLTQSVNGILLPILLTAMVLLTSNKEIMGEYANSRRFNIFAWFAVAVLSTLSLLMISKTLWDVFVG